ncbi:hypothetical protein EWF20_00010 [Sulfolobus sp. S-194]|uniref:hypothetical protein n=1 Tax=Sulfolobus sp. S-194 TaxID=2512240 RepID=UPI0014370ACD|nr:hypothetical protein [Sulfolobus sp. S-194]QIW22708.1 hypothetical protein EWF20_00010 [Sulfolobus sp. S-194]
MISLNFQQIIDSPLFILLVTISIPLTAFFILLFKVILPKTSKPKTLQQPPPSEQVPQQQQQQEKTQQLEETFKILINKIDKYQSDLANVINTSMNDLKQMIQSMNSSIEDVVLSLKASQADSTSPFNIITKESDEGQKPEGAKSLKAMAEIVGTSNIDLTSFVRNCVLLEVLEYDDSKITALYELGYISADDMYILMKIQSYIRANSGKIRAKELANIAMNVAESYSAITADMKKYLLVLEANKNG